MSLLQAIAFIFNAVVTAVGVFVYIQKREDKIMAALKADIQTVTETGDEIKRNYLSRFEHLSDKINDVKIELVRELGSIGADVKLLLQNMK